jgi:hypothetical protein
LTTTTDNSPTAVLKRFYDAERKYMKAGGQPAGTSFDEFASTLAPDVVLHQSPDLPYRGENPEFLENAEGDKVVALCTLVTKARRTGVVQVIRVRDGKIVDLGPFIGTCQLMWLLRRTLP